MEKLRCVEFYSEATNEWLPCMIQDLHIGYKFRMFEPNGDAVAGNKGDTEFLAISEPYLNKNNIWTIDIEE